MIQVIFNDAQKYSLPESWEEIIDKGRYLEIIKVLNQPFDKIEWCKLAVFSKLTGFDGKALGILLKAGNRKQRLRASSNINVGAAVQICDNVFPALDFIFNKVAFIRNPLPVFTHRGKTFEGPADKLSNQTGEEWLITHHAQTLYHEDQEYQKLIPVIAANYHEVVDGKRLPFSEEKMSADAALLADLPAEIAHGIYLWYGHSDKWWSDKFPHLFSQEEGEEQKPLTGLEVRKLLFRLGGNQIGSDWDVVKKRSRQEIFITLDDLDEQRVAAEEAAKE